MAAAKRKSIAKLCLALGLFVLAGFFRQADRVGAPLPSAAFFLLTNLIYIGLAMGVGLFHISHGFCTAVIRRCLLLGCAMAVLWLFLRTVKYRFFDDELITPLSVVFVLCAADSRAAVQPVRRAAAWAAGGRRVFAPVVSAVSSGDAADRRRSDQRSASDGLPRRAGRCNAGRPTISTAGCTTSPWRGSVVLLLATGGCGLSQVPRV